MFTKLIGLLLGCVSVSAVQAEEFTYLVMPVDDSPQRVNFHSEIINICHTNANTLIFRVITPSMGSTQLGITGGGHICQPGEMPVDLVLKSRVCEIVSETYLGKYDCGYDKWPEK